MSGPSAALKGQTVMVVDDVPADLGLLAHVLEECGLTVVVVRGGEEALARAERVRPDLILLDAAMPAPDGFDTCLRLKQRDGLREVPVIFMTAAAGEDGALRSFEVGGVDYVTKPLKIDEVLARIHTHLMLRLAQRRLAEQNAKLHKEIALRRQIETHLQTAYEQLEERVAQRTDELARANDRLTAEIDERTRIEKSLHRNEVRIRHLIESNILAIISFKLDGAVTEANDAFLNLIGYTRQELRKGAVHLMRISPPEYAALIESEAEELRRSGSLRPFEKEYFHKDGRRVPVLIGGTFYSRELDEGMAFVLDLSGHKAAEERIRYLADHDALTGLPNRVLLRDRLQQALAHAHRTGTEVAVLFIDLDYFKHINDSLGHRVGDDLLRNVADRLSRCVREGDSVARLGGDEFVLTLPLVSDCADVAMVAQKALDALDEPFHCAGHELHVRGSIGISMYPGDGSDVETLMRMADTAMYHAKEKGRGNYQFFTAAMNKAAQRRLAISNSLRHALARKEFTLFYQPQVDMESGTIFSAEALLRWCQQGKAPISCHEFVALAEETGQILPIGEWVLREACMQLKRWHEQGFADMTIAVNLSARQFYQPNFLGTLKAILDDSGIPPQCLDLEITETMLMQRSEDNVAALQHLSGMGVKLSIDDFGTGYSSLAYLQRFPVDALKIDRSFISGIGQDTNDTTLVSAIISMAHSLRLKVLAEGVETAEQITFLRAHGCLWAQGYFYSKAVSAEEFTELLRKRQRRTVDA